MDFSAESNFVLGTLIIIVLLTLKYVDSTEESALTGMTVCLSILLLRLVYVTKPPYLPAISSMEYVALITFFTWNFSSAVRINFRPLSLPFSFAAFDDI